MGKRDSGSGVWKVRLHGNDEEHPLPELLGMVRSGTVDADTRVQPPAETRWSRAGDVMDLAYEFNRLWKQDQQVRRVLGEGRTGRGGPAFAAAIVAAAVGVIVCLVLAAL